MRSCETRAVRPTACSRRRSRAARRPPPQPSAARLVRGASHRPPIAFHGLLGGGAPQWAALGSATPDQQLQKLAFFLAHTVTQRLALPPPGAAAAKRAGLSEAVPVKALVRACMAAVLLLQLEEVWGTSLGGLHAPFVAARGPA